MDIQVKKPSNEKRDFQKFFIAKPDSTFSPERNKWVIKNSMRKHESNIKRRSREYMDRLRERSHAVRVYLDYVEGGGGKPIEMWIGKRELARLQGRRITQTVLDARNKLIGLGTR